MRTSIVSVKSRYPVWPKTHVADVKEMQQKPMLSSEKTMMVQKEPGPISVSGIHIRNLILHHQGQITDQLFIIIRLQI